MTVARERIVVAAAVIGRGDEVLLTQRPTGTHLAGAWEFPGGKVEPGESPEAACVRECAEELGVTIRVLDVLDVTFHAYPHRDVLLVFYAATITHGDIQHLGVAGHRWVPTASLRDDELPPADVQVAAKIRAGRLAALRSLVGA